MTEPSFHSESVTLEAADGQRLGGTVFLPARAGNGLSVQINGATGVPARYYAAFAGYLAGCGFTVLTYDYRGIAASPHTPGAPPPRMRDWGMQDMVAAAAWLDSRHPGLTRTMVAHSFGGQGIGLMPQAGDFAAIVTIASQQGYWRNWPAPQRWRLALIWHVALPVVLKLRGHMPGSLIGGEDLPIGVAREWSRWCRSPHYICDEAGAPLRPYNDRVRAAIRMVSFADDVDFGPRRGVDALMDYYPNARIERLHVAPADWGLERIGHFGFFKRAMPAERWAEVAGWLQQQAGMPSLPKTA